MPVDKSDRADRAPAASQKQIAAGGTVPDVAHDDDTHSPAQHGHAPQPPALSGQSYSAAAVSTKASFNVRLVNIVQ